MSKTKTSALGCSRVCTLSCKDTDTHVKNTSPVALQLEIWKSRSHLKGHFAQKLFRVPPLPPPHTTPLPLNLTLFWLTCLVVALSLDFGAFAVPGVLTVPLPTCLRAPVVLESLKTKT